LKPQLQHQYLQAFIDHFVQPNTEEWNNLLKFTTYVEYKKNDIIENAHDKVTKLHFVIEGIARHYFLDANNNEITNWISEPGGLSTDYAAFTLGKKTIYQIQAVTAIKAICITNENLNFLYDNFKVWERLGRLLNQQYLNDFIDRNNFLMQLSAKEKYETLLLSKPHLFNIVPLKHLATYLGITVETLSRLRSKTY
jgi:CRP/FNR family transcriptional regulator, anaerobic regulatory protein